jgi:hypothetical protein
LALSLSVPFQIVTRALDTKRVLPAKNATQNVARTALKMFPLVRSIWIIAVIDVNAAMQYTSGLSAHGQLSVVWQALSVIMEIV